MTDAQPPRQTIRTLQARKRIALIAHDGKNLKCSSGRLAGKTRSASTS